MAPAAVEGMAVPRVHRASAHELTDRDVADVRRALLEWYTANARVLPWRVPAVPAALPSTGLSEDAQDAQDAHDAVQYDAHVQRVYICLVSETMLQQTQVRTVVDYFNRWLEKFPSMAALAGAAEDDVMAAWAGLGYYSRARRLRQAAVFLVDNFTAARRPLPGDVEYWVKQVPGVGPYTAGAILSIATDTPTALVDGNVCRVASRLLAVHGDVTTPKSAGAKLVWRLAEGLVTADGGSRAGDFNQSLMELGATVCTPVAPSCKACPVATACRARANYEALVRWRKTRLFKSDGLTAAGASEFSAQLDVEDLCKICPNDIATDELPPKPDTYLQSLYPYKPAKKKPRVEQSLVVVFTRACHTGKGNREGEGEGDDAVEILVEKRAAGLLAGLYDFPTLLLPPPGSDVDGDGGGGGEETTADQRRDTLLRRINASPLIDNVKTVGRTLHLFTHIRRHSTVLHCRLTDEKSAEERSIAHERNLAAALCDLLTSTTEKSAAAEPERRWVTPTEETFKQLGVSELFRKTWRLHTGELKSYTGSIPAGATSPASGLGGGGDVPPTRAASKARGSKKKPAAKRAKRSASSDEDEAEASFSEGEDEDHGDDLFVPPTTRTTRSKRSRPAVSAADAELTALEVKDEPAISEKTLRSRRPLRQATLNFARRT